MKPGSVNELKAMLMRLDPVLSKRPWCYQRLSDDAFIPDTAFAVIRESEGPCAILPAPAANDGAVRFARITLALPSNLEAVGLTAAVATTLASSGIACNIVAGLMHDHLLVPWKQREEALVLLEKMSMDARR